MSLLVVGGIDAGCTLITSRQNGQCLSDTDCRAKGGAFGQTRCSAQGTCEVITLPESGVDAGIACTTNAECSTLLASRARCIKQGAGTGTCQSILNDQCTASDGDSNDDNAIFIGVMTPRTGPNEVFGINQYQVAVAGAKDWQSQIAGQVGTHNFVTIGCDELVDPAGVANFLTSQVHVAAILGPIYDGDFEQVIPVANATGTFLIGSRVDDVKLPTLQGIGQNVWSCMPNRSTQVALFPPLMSDIETSIKVSHPSAIKVFFAVASDTSSTDFANAAEQVMTFNGASALSQTGGNYVRQNFTFDFSKKPDYSATISAMILAAPDLVIVAQEYDVANFVKAMNDSWPGTGTPLPRLLLLATDPAVQSNLLAPGQNRFAGKVDFLSWNRSLPEQTNAVSFAAAYRANAQQDPAPESERLYDCFYENAYALQIGLDQGTAVEGITPLGYGTAIASLNSPGTTHNVGSSDIPPMLTLLSAKGDSDLEGASSALEMDPKQGAPTQNVNLNCIQTDGGVKSSGVQFDGVDGGATGSYSCL